jgi:hypothetical protein
MWRSPASNKTVSPAKHGGQKPQAKRRHLSCPTTQRRVLVDRRLISSTVSDLRERPGSRTHAGIVARVGCMELGLIQGDHAIPVLAAWVATLTIIVVKMSCAAGVAGWLWSEDHIKRAAAGDAEALSGDPRHRGQRLGPDCELCLPSGPGRQQPG